MIIIDVSTIFCTKFGKREKRTTLLEHRKFSSNGNRKLQSLNIFLKRPTFLVFPVLRFWITFLLVNLDRFLPFLTEWSFGQRVLTSPPREFTFDQLVNSILVGPNPSPTSFRRSQNTSPPGLTEEYRKKKKKSGLEDTTSFYISYNN